MLCSRRAVFQAKMARQAEQKSVHVGTFVERAASSVISKWCSAICESMFGYYCFEVVAKTER
jgi:hypothetical protein